MRLPANLAPQDVDRDERDEKLSCVSQTEQWHEDYLSRGLLRLNGSRFLARDPVGVTP